MTMSLPALVARRGQRGTTSPPPRPQDRSLIEAWLNLVGLQSLRPRPPLHPVSMRLMPPLRLLQRPRPRLIRHFIPCCEAKSQHPVAVGRRENPSGTVSFRPNPLRLPPRHILVAAAGQAGQQPAERVAHRPSLRPHHGRRGTATSPPRSPRVAAAHQTAALGPPRQSCSAWRACGRRWGRPRWTGGRLASTQASRRLRRSAGEAAAAVVAEVGPRGQRTCPSERRAATRRYRPPPPPRKTCPSALRGGTTTRQGPLRRLRKTCPFAPQGLTPRRPLTPTRARDTATAPRTRPPAVRAAALGTPRPRPLPRSASSRRSSRCSSPSCAPRLRARLRRPRRPKLPLPARMAAAAAVAHPTTTTGACLGAGRRWRVPRRPCVQPRGLRLRGEAAPPLPPPPLPRLHHRPTPMNTPPAPHPRWRSAGQALPLIPTEEEEAAAARASGEAGEARGCLR